MSVIDEEMIWDSPIISGSQNTAGRIFWEKTFNGGSTLDRSLLTGRGISTQRGWTAGQNTNAWIGKIPTDLCRDHELQRFSQRRMQRQACCRRFRNAYVTATGRNRGKSLVKKYDTNGLVQWTTSLASIRMTGVIPLHGTVGQLSQGRTIAGRGTLWCANSIPAVYL